MAPSKTSVRVKYSNPGTQPPVYVAGSFSEPAWNPEEMQYTTDQNNEHEFYKDVEVEQGQEYQYKFRLGPGDWWLLNENSPTATDNNGNRNNLLLLPKSEENIPAPASDNDATEPKDGEPIASIILKKKVSKEPVSKDTNGLHAGDELDRQGTVTPDMAKVASDVADSAADLDREQPTPSISDEEAGKIGLRRLSNTPIPEVANTAAEVADSAALLDRHDMKIEMPYKQSDPEPESQDNFDSGTITPWEERAPLFEHECMGSQSGEYPQAKYQPHALEQIASNEEALLDDDIDYNDPTLEEFPHDRQSILERVRTVETRLDEDETKFDGSPLSPVVSANRSPDKYLPSPSPALLATDQHPSPSLQSIAEEHGEQPEETLVRLPSAANLRQSNGHASSEDLSQTEDSDISAKRGHKSSVDSQEVEESSVPGLTEPVPGSKVPPEQTSNGSHQEPKSVVNNEEVKEGEPVKEIGTGEEGPSIILHPATPSSSSINVTTESLKNPTEQAKSSAVETDDEQTHLISRKKQSSPLERSVTPSSVHSEQGAKSQNFLIAFWRVVFVDWFGGIISRLCGGRRHTLLAISALLVFTIAPALYFRA